MTPDSRIHRADTVRPFGSPGEAISLDQYIETARRRLTYADLVRIPGFRAEIEKKLATEQARQHGDLQRGVRILETVLEEATRRAGGEPIPEHVWEALVALDYFVRGADLIPDHVEEIGLTDDARLVAKVFARNPELSKAIAA